MGKHGHNKQRKSHYQTKCGKCQQFKCRCKLVDTTDVTVDLNTYTIDHEEHPIRRVDLDCVRGSIVDFNSGEVPITLTSTVPFVRSIAAAVGGGSSAVSTGVIGGTISATNPITAPLLGFAVIMPRDGIITSIVWSFTVTSGTTIGDNVRLFAELFGSRFSEQTSIFTEIQASITPATHRIGTSPVAAGTVFFGANTKRIRVEAGDRIIVIFGFVSESGPTSAPADIEGNLSLSLAIDENFCSFPPKEKSESEEC